MKKLITTILMCIAVKVYANPNELSFCGVVDASAKFRVGEPFQVTVFFNPVNGIIQRYDLSIGMDFQLRGIRNGSVAYDNSGVGNVYYQIIDSDFMEVTAYTPLTVGPDCIQDWAIAEFALFNNPLLDNTSGHLTSLPVIR